MILFLTLVTYITNNTDNLTIFKCFPQVNLINYYNFECILFA